MIIRTLAEMQDTERNVDWGNGQSYRFLIEADNMGFTLTETIVNAGTASLLQYNNHLEACYCIEGEGEVECAGQVYPIKPGTMYAPNEHDKHYLRASPNQALRLVCVFSPALKGTESHRLNGDSTKASSY